VSAPVNIYKVSYPQGGYRTFKSFDVWNAYLLALEDMGHRWELMNDLTARVMVSA